MPVYEFQPSRLAALIRTKQAGRNLRDLSEEITRDAGEVSPSTLSRVMNEKSVDLETLQFLCSWLAISPGELFTADSPEPDTAGKVRALLHADGRLSDATVTAVCHLLEIALKD